MTNQYLSGIDEILNGFLGLDRASEIAEKINKDEEFVFSQLEVAGLFPKLNREAPSEEVFERLFLDDEGLFVAADSFSFDEWTLGYYFEEVFEILKLPIHQREQLRASAGEVFGDGCNRSYDELGIGELPISAAMGFVKVAYDLPIFAAKLVDDHDMRHQIRTLADFLRERGVFNEALGLYWYCRDPAGLVACSNKLEQLGPTRFSGFLATLTKLKDNLADEVASVLRSGGSLWFGEDLAWKIDALYCCPLTQSKMPDSIETVRLALLSADAYTAENWPSEYKVGSSHFQLRNKAMHRDQVAARLLHGLESASSWNHDRLDTRSYPSAIKAAKLTQLFINDSSHSWGDGLSEAQIQDIVHDLRSVVISDLLSLQSSQIQERTMDDQKSIEVWVSSFDQAACVAKYIAQRYGVTPKVSDASYDEDELDFCDTSDYWYGDSFWKPTYVAVERYRIGPAIGWEKYGHYLICGATENGENLYYLIATASEMSDGCAQELASDLNSAVEQGKDLTKERPERIARESVIFSGANDPTLVPPKPKVIVTSWEVSWPVPDPPQTSKIPLGPSDEMLNQAIALTEEAIKDRQDYLACSKRQEISENVERTVREDEWDDVELEQAELRRELLRDSDAAARSEEEGWYYDDGDYIPED